MPRLAVALFALLALVSSEVRATTPESLVPPLASPFALAGSGGEAPDRHPAAFLLASTVFVVGRVFVSAAYGHEAGFVASGREIAMWALGPVIDVLALKLLGNAFGVNPSWEATAKGVFLVGIGGALAGALVGYELGSQVTGANGLGAVTILSAVVCGSIASPLGVYLFDSIENTSNARPGAGGDLAPAATRPDVRRQDQLPRPASLSLLGGAF